MANYARIGKSRFPPKSPPGQPPRAELAGPHEVHLVPFEHMRVFFFSHYIGISRRGGPLTGMHVLSLFFCSLHLAKPRPSSYHVLVVSGAEIFPLVFLVPFL